MTLCPAEDNRYGYAAKQAASPPAAGNTSLDPAAPAPPEAGFWQRFRKDLKSTGQQLGKALGRTRDELSYSYHTSTTKFPRTNNLNRHQKRFSGHVRTRNEAQSVPYKAPPVLVQPRLSPPAPSTHSRPPKPRRQSKPPSRTPVEIIRPKQQPVTKKTPVNTPPVNTPPTKQKETSSLPEEKNDKPPTPLTPPPKKQDTPLTPAPKENVADKKPEPTKKPDYPVALKTENTGFVKSPYPPFALLDVRDIKPGGLAMEPDSDRIFRVPE